MREQLETLAFRDFGLSVGERVVFDGLTLQLRTPSLWAVVGRRRMARTMLVRVLSGDPPGPTMRTTGSVTLCGRALSRINRPELVVLQRGIDGTLLEVLAQGLPGIVTLSRSDLRRRLEESLECRGLERLINHLGTAWRQLPLSMQRLASVVRHALAEPWVLVVEDGLEGLSDAETAPVMELLRFEGRRRTVLVTTADPETGLTLGGHIAFIPGAQDGLLITPAVSRQFVAA